MPSGRGNNGIGIYRKIDETFNPSTSVERSHSTVTRPDVKRLVFGLVVLTALQAFCFVCVCVFHIILSEFSLILELVMD